MTENKVENKVDMILSPLDTMRAIEYWLNNIMFKTPVKVIDIKSKNKNTNEEYTVTFKTPVRESDDEAHTQY